MKLLIRITAAAAMALGLGLIVSAQQPAPAKVLAEVASGAAAVKGQPFSADTVNESVQTLADGNRIVQTMNGKIYRNSEGRVRREMTGGNGGNAGFGNNTFFFDYGPRVSIAEPAGGHRVLLNEKEKTAFTVSVVPEGEVKVLTQAGKGEGFGTGTGVGRGTGVTTVRTVTDGAPLTEEQRKAVETLRGYKEGDPLTPEQQKAKELLKAHSIELARTGAMLATTVAPVARGFATAAPGAEPWLVGGFGDSKWETKTDDLGTQNIEGVTCVDTRRTTTIPAGALGNVE